MTVTVDEIRVWPTRLRCFKAGSCHLMADSEEELHAFAKKLGLRREWYQPKSAPHYDLTPAKREEALRLGAVAVSAREEARKRLIAKGLLDPKTGLLRASANLVLRKG